ncbi:MAG: 4Fe-4S binding protein [Acidobacteria bacterium]|nr:4Fe-4S binding protein [Acidobacteriota bacterium]
MAKKFSSIHRRLQLLRIFSQIFFFGLFVYLLLETRYSGKDYIGAVERFFHFDPLLGLTSFLASRAFLAAFLWALIPVALALIFGRYICGWVCPFGAVLQFFSYLFKKMKWHAPEAAGTRLLYLKYAILIAVLIASIFALDLAGYFDPLSFLYRSFITTVLPAFAITGDSATSVLPNFGSSAPQEGIRQFLQSLAINRTFHQGLLIGLIFLAVILLNLYRERFWCRYLCPTGALFALLARWNLVKVKVDAERCTQCKLCTLHCQTQATPFPNEDWQPGECVYCYSCAAKCPTAAITFPILAAPVEAKSIDFGRRKWIFTSALSLAVIPLFRISTSGRPSEKLIRPPGAQPEPQFLAACVKCGECMKVCPTNALQPALNQAGPEGLWTPVLVPRIGSCEYYCSLCTQVCPTGAIKELKIKEKIKVKIGSAWIKKDRCIPYALGDSCSVCEEQCPTSPKAIHLVETEMMMPDGTWAPQRLPVVDLDACIGCGICETRCPVEDDPAIYCTSLGESRALIKTI